MVASRAAAGSTRCSSSWSFSSSCGCSECISRYAAGVQKAPPGGDRMLRVPYGHEELEFMVQPWFDVDTVESAPATPVGDLLAAPGASLAAPLGSKRLRDLAADAKRAAGTRRPRAVIAV